MPTIILQFGDENRGNLGCRETGGDVVVSDHKGFLTVVEDVEELGGTAWPKGRNEWMPTTSLGGTDSFPVLSGVGSA